MRADFAILDKPVASVNTHNVDEVLNHCILLCEVKRDNTNTDYIENTQVKPLLDFSKRLESIALYWNDVIQRVFWIDHVQNKRVYREGPISFLPRFGQAISVKPITSNDTTPPDSLIDVFTRIEDILHSASIDLDQRFNTILQLILAKLYDEHGHGAKQTEPLDIQDYNALGYTGQIALERFNITLGKATSFYQRHLPKKVDNKLHPNITSQTLFDICKILAPLKITSTKRDVIQTFYMYFAKSIYKWDLAQYFTPPSVIDFIIDVLNPQFGEHIKDPACGSADFLTAAFHKKRGVSKDYADCLWGADNSTNAVQVAVLNMLLNGDGKTNIKHQDSLAHVNEELNHYDIMVCNPPFGVRILEKSQQTLAKFDLGHQCETSELTFTKTSKILPHQEKGILFLELCVAQAKPGGRIGVILPNGYLGNRSTRYKALRHWMLLNCKLVSICAFPRFTFKTSGADVSASVLFLEKRATPLQTIERAEEYYFNVEMIENVGWNLGDKKAAPRYLRNQEDGAYIIDDNGERILDSDFTNILQDIRDNSIIVDFPWLAADCTSTIGEGWSYPIKNIIDDSDLTLDPKRLCKKFITLRQQLSKRDHKLLGEIVDFIPDNSSNKRSSTNNVIDSKTYHYVELQDIGYGDFRYTDLRGWELPARAKHHANPGDLFVGSIWGSVSKWCCIPKNTNDIIVTNGCHRIIVKNTQSQYFIDLITFFSSEAYSIQMRGFARGSDGLADISADDAEKVIVPLLSDKEREALRPIAEEILNGSSYLQSRIKSLREQNILTTPEYERRPSHVVLV